MSGIKVGLNLGGGIGVNLQAGPLRLNIGIGGVGPNSNGQGPNRNANASASAGSGQANAGVNGNGNGNRNGQVNAGPGPAGNGNAYGRVNGNGNGNAYGRSNLGIGENGSVGVNANINPNARVNGGGNTPGQINANAGIQTSELQTSELQTSELQTSGLQSNPVSQTIRSASTSAINYLTGNSSGADLLPGARQALDQLSSATGRSAVQRFIERGSLPASEIIGRFTNQINQTLNQTGASSFLRDQFPRGPLDEVINTIRLEQHFANLEKTYGLSTQRARELALSLLANEWARQTNCNCRSSITAAELLRDLRSSALVQLRDLNSPFPLTGIRLASAEIAALILTLEAIERALGLANTVYGYNLASLNALMGWLGIDRELALLLLGNWLGLPGRMGRYQIMNFFAGLGGMLNDASGRPLLVKDGIPLRLGELLWFNLLGGLLDSSLAMDRSKLSPLLSHGFDAIFSLVGFDGRGLPLPHFMAIQSQANGEQPEWSFGQPPLSEGWMRAMIERLKDAASADQNLLGERLEVALVEGRFFLGILCGAVEEGRSVPESFNFDLASTSSAGIRLPAPNLAFC